MKLLILLALIPFFSSTKIRIRLPPVLSELREIKEKFVAHGLNNMNKLRININNKINRKTPTTTGPTIPAITTTTTTTTTMKAITTTKPGRKQIGVESKKLVSLITSFLKEMRGQTEDSTGLTQLGFPTFSLMTNLA